MIANQKIAVYYYIHYYISVDKKARIFALLETGIGEASPQTVQPITHLINESIPETS